MKKILAIILSILISLSLVGCKSYMKFDSESDMAEVVEGTWENSTGYNVLIIKDNHIYNYVDYGDTLLEEKNVEYLFKKGKIDGGKYWEYFVIDEKTIRHSSNVEFTKTLDSTETSSTTSENNSQETKNSAIDKLEKELPDSLYVRDAGDTAAFETIKFQNDIIRNKDTLEGHCSYSYYDGSGKEVSFKYYDGIVTANVMEDEHIEKYVSNNSAIATYNYFFYENFMIGERKSKAGLVNTEGNFDMIFGNCQYNMDGTVRYVDGMYEDGYYSGTYTREGNIVKINTYCETTNQNTEWYLYIDKDGAVYQEVYIRK